MTWTTHGFIAVWITVRYTSIDIGELLNSLGDYLQKVFFFHIKNGGLTNQGESHHPQCKYRGD